MQKIIAVAATIFSFFHKKAVGISPAVIGPVHASILSAVLLSGTGVAALLFVLARILPNDRLEAWGFAAGNAAKAVGIARLGLPAWTKVQDFLENSSGAFFKGVLRSWNDAADAGGK